MFQFEVDNDGLLRESAIRDMVSKLKDRFPETDELSLESHLMLELTHTVLADMRTAAWTEYGLTGRRFTLLRLLYLAKDRRLSMGEVAANLNVGTNNTTQLVDGMMRDGLVRRVNAPDDKRVVYAELTERGEELFAAVFPVNSQRVRETWAPLSEKERRLLIHLFSRLRLHLLTEDDASGFIGDAAPSQPPAREPRGKRPRFRAATMSQPD